MSVRGAVEDALVSSAAPVWKLELARSLAEVMDASPNASTAKELRAVMDDLGAVVAVKQEDAADDLAAKRAARRAASS